MWDKNLRYNKKGLHNKKVLYTIMIISFVTVGTIVPLLILFGPQELSADWEEAIEWMRNLSTGTIITSWEDYGSYIIYSGKCRTPNFLDETVVGLVGRLFMADNESESIEILNEWGATYVLVYWSYYYPNGGGDEGKWPSMIESAHEQLQGTKWEIEVGDRWNDTSSKPTCEFFNTTIWKMLTYNETFIDYDDEPFIIEYLFQNGYPLGYFQARLNWADPWVPGTQPYQGSWEDDSGHLWKYHNPPLGQGMVDDGYIDYDGQPDDDTVGIFQNLNNFTLAFISSGHLIKIFKVI